MAREDADTFQRDGFVVLERALEPADRDALVDALAPYESVRPLDGQRRQRTVGLAGKGDAFLHLAEHPRVIALLDRVLMPNYLLSTLQALRVLPGEPRRPWHTDDALYFVPRPHALPLAVGVIWAIDDFTEDNGAPELVPGSHRWGLEHPDTRDHDVYVAAVPAGSAIVFDAALWHRGGANRTARTRLGITPQYCQPWLRPQESQLLIVPPDAAHACSERVRALLGYSVHPPFIGQVDGAPPLRLHDSRDRPAVALVK